MRRFDFEIYPHEAYIDENDEGKYVLFSDVMALLAENVALKERNRNNLEFIAEELGDPEFRAESVKTPDTDAAIAEIELKTIRELVSKVSEDLKQKGQSARRIANLDFTWAYIETARAEMHNANLRAGRKG